MVVIDVRMKDKPLFSFSAHNETVSQISFSSAVPGIFHFSVYVY